MQLILDNVNLRVNSLPVERVGVRYQIVDGYPGGPKEIVIDDPILGQFALDHTFSLEIQESEGPWRKTTPQALLALIEARSRTAAW